MCAVQRSPKSLFLRARARMNIIKVGPNTAKFSIDSALGKAECICESLPVIESRPLCDGRLQKGLGLGAVRLKI